MQGVSAGLSAALELDAAGNPGEAFNVLKRASAAGDLPSMTELGHRLLTGDRAPKMVDHALSLLSNAARGGEGRALARLAALNAAGAYMTQDLPGALNLLAAAADAGDAGAQGQLTCLQAPHAAPASWSAMAARVAWGDWLTAAPVIALEPRVGRVLQLAPAAVCDWLIARARPRLGRALVYDAVERRDLAHDMRTNSAANFDYACLDVVQFLVQARMARTCGQRQQQLEAPMVLHYRVGQQIRPHFDFIDTAAPDYEQQIREQGQRMITFLLYLNEGYDGGETTFPELGIVNRGRRGEGLYFINSRADRSADRQMLHTGSPPTRGEKWIVTQFIRDIALRP
ncbi:MAG: 2OG-Fe(II) oxygenase [Proteobacteria bacterium]|jgi:prolyl 4-hydroxylase|nr:2OG-Fe(II) oxygenase [Pseudomonadota bacterium]MBK7115307.1 2OG-Fe(II) oxygenase [Pseudomonadota bacterium]MBK9253678.1 2OG-Fe(II) oxygenase [Pseudomonadota bacterium]MCC6630443.1 2OG-Fe(II) oxygenase [Gammaproteobacteria bacterium]